MGVFIIEIFKVRDTKDFIKYYEVAEKIGVTPLSFLHFPEWEFFAFIPSTIKTSISWALKNRLNFKLSEFRNKSGKFAKVKIKNRYYTIRTAKPSPKCIKFDKGQSILFR